MMNNYALWADDCNCAFPSKDFYFETVTVAMVDGAVCLWRGSVHLGCISDSAISRPE